jgi:hypothetical protein
MGTTGLTEEAANMRGFLILLEFIQGRRLMLQEVIR